MGVRHLNKYLRKHCPNSIKTIHLTELKGKKIVVDISIYLYKYLAEEALMENMYLLISILLHYNIEPVFIFDGKPPVEKYNTIDKRKQDRKSAKMKLLELENVYKTENNIKNKKDLLLKIQILKRNSVMVTRNHIHKIKDLLDAYGIQYIVSTGEADELCGYLIETGKAWGCLSDDTDMFVYKCNYVLRDINLLHHTVALYDKEQILEDLNINEYDFNQILVVSSSEYSHNIDITIGQVIILYRKYKGQLLKYSFYVWLLKTTSYIKDYKELLNVYQIYNMRFINDVNMQAEKPKDINKIKTIMKNEGFIFI